MDGKKQKRVCKKCCGYVSPTVKQLDAFSASLRPGLVQRLEDIYDGAGAGRVNVEGEAIDLEQLARVTPAIRNCILPPGREFLMAMEHAPHFATPAKAADFILVNCELEWWSRGPGRCRHLKKKDKTSK